MFSISDLSLQSDISLTCHCIFKILPFYVTGQLSYIFSNNFFQNAHVALLFFLHCTFFLMTWSLILPISLMWIYRQHRRGGVGLHHVTHLSCPPLDLHTVVCHAHRATTPPRPKENVADLIVVRHVLLLHHVGSFSSPLLQCRRGPSPPLQHWFCLTSSSISITSPSPCAPSFAEPKPLTTPSSVKSPSHW